MAIAQCGAGNIGVIPAIGASNLQSHNAGYSYSASQHSHDSGYPYPATAVAQIPIPSYSSGPLQQEVKVVKIVEDHGHANVVVPQTVSYQHVKHIKVHQGLQSYPDQGYYSVPATPKYVKVLKVTHQEGQQPQHIEVIRVHHGDHGHGHKDSVTTPIVQQNQAPVQPIKIIKVIHDQDPIDHSTHHQIAEPIFQNQATPPVKVIKVYHDNSPVSHGYATAVAAAPMAPADSSSIRW